jgi:hypothetical protein
MFKIINPIDYPKWDELVLSTKGYSFFHSSAWAKVLHQTYGYTPHYFTIVEDGKLLALFPMMEIRSILTGKRGVSLPFSDYCEPIISDGISFQEMLDFITSYGKKRGWKYVEFRGAQNFLDKEIPSESYLGHTLDLTKDIDEIFSKFRESTRRNIGKAEREGVKVGIFNSSDSVREFCRLNCITRKHHGLPPQPYLFFKNIYKSIISKNLGFVFLASHNKKIIAGAVYFHCGEKAFYKYGASEKNYQQLRANNLVMWEAVKWYAQNGYKSFCFGRTEPDNKGLLQFKAGWGAKEYFINYYKYDFIKESFVNDFSKVKGLHNKVFKNMPIPLLKITGSILYKHMG